MGQTIQIHRIGCGGDPDCVRTLIRGYDIGLPPKTAYACLTETALLAMEGRFEDYTVGRDIEIERVKKIYRLFKKHGFRLTGLRSFGQYITDEDVTQKRVLAEVLRQDETRFRQMQADAESRMVRRPPADKAGAAVATGIAAALLLARRNR